ncbi:MAG: sulfatase-like hydrolase/transferase [Ginsengibacter sp.]
MKKYIPHITYFLFWILFFIITKAIFLLYHSRLSESLSATEIFKVFLYGLRMDASFTAYICIVPFLLLFVRSVLTKLKLQKIIKIYTFILLIFLSFLTVADLDLYKRWGFRMDATPLQYFKNPGEMVSSSANAPILLLLVIMLANIFLFLSVYKIFTVQSCKNRSDTRRFPTEILLSFFFLIILFIPIRGGIQKIPINQSDVYFSKKLFADHAALNLPWNITHSILNKESSKNPFTYFAQDKAEHLVDSLYDTNVLKIPSILNTQKPDIIFIILESFTAKLVGCVGGEKGITPNLDQIAADGLVFTNIYAAGDRSEKGQVAILSGYPNQAITSIIKTPTKTAHLPSINHALQTAGYRTSYTYGGELEFANIKSYLMNTGFAEVTGKYEFPASQRTTSWGVHDHILFEKFLQELSGKPQPFFATAFTLSSHEPFDVPMKPHFPAKDETTLFKNSVYYTDSVLGNFINKIKKENWWKNTLVVLVADHGHPLPGDDANDMPSKFHIPLIFAGGALSVKGVNHSIGSQTDIATTILHQLQISTDKFVWGKDLLDTSANQFAFYTFNNGFGFVTPSGAVTVDNIAGKTIRKDAAVDSAAINSGKAYMQVSYADFLKR